MTHSLLASVLLLAACFDDPAQPDERPKSPFEKATQDLVFSAAVNNHLNGFMPSFAYYEILGHHEFLEELDQLPSRLSWTFNPPSASERLNTSFVRERISYALSVLDGFVSGMKQIEELKKTPLLVVEALQGPDGDDRVLSLGVVNAFASLARTSAHESGQRDLERATRRVFEPHTAKVRSALDELLRSGTPAVRSGAATAILAFEPDHATANAVLVEAYNAQAAVAAWQIGPRAKELAPGLAQFLEAGEPAYGEAYYYGHVALPRYGNLPLMALEKMGPAAWPAIGGLVRLIQTPSAVRPPVLKEAIPLPFEVKGAAKEPTLPLIVLQISARWPKLPRRPSKSC